MKSVLSPPTFFQEGLPFLCPANEVRLTPRLSELSWLKMDGLLGTTQFILVSNVWGRTCVYDSPMAPAELFLLKPQQTGKFHFSFQSRPHRACCPGTWEIPAFTVFLQTPIQVTSLSVTPFLWPKECERNLCQLVTSRNFKSHYMLSSYILFLLPWDWCDCIIFLGVSLQGARNGGRGGAA